MMECDYKKGESIDLYRAIISIVVGIVVGAAFYFGAIAGAGTLIEIILALGLFSIAVIIGALFIDSVSDRNDRCCYGTYVYNDTRGGLLASIGAIVTSIVALSIGVTVGTILSAVLVGLTAIFAFLVIVKIFSIINKLINQAEKARD